MNISSEKTDLKNTYLAIVTMLLAILCVDMYMVVIKFLGNENLTSKVPSDPSEIESLMS